jgi:hypothetical protein
MALVLSDILAAHENSKVEFKLNSSNVQGIVREVIAFAKPHRRRRGRRHRRQDPRGGRRR